MELLQDSFQGKRSQTKSSQTTANLTTGSLHCFVLLSASNMVQHVVHCVICFLCFSFFFCFCPHRLTLAFASSRGLNEENGPEKFLDETQSEEVKTVEMQLKWEV